MSPSLLALLTRAEQRAQRDAAAYRRAYMSYHGATRRQAAHYGARNAWPDAVQLVRRDGAETYR